MRGMPKRPGWEGCVNQQREMQEGGRRLETGCKGYAAQIGQGAPGGEQEAWFGDNTKGCNEVWLGEKVGGCV